MYEGSATVIAFRLDARSNVVPYLQLVDQVRQSLRTGMLTPGDQLPTVRDVASTLAINPNTVVKAYRELELEGLVVGRPGRGTFVVRTLAGPALASHSGLRRDLVRWLRRAKDAGLDDDEITALIQTTLRAQAQEGVA